MADGVLLGLDVGTSAVKAGAFDARSGAALASATRAIRVDARPGGARELAPADLRAALRRCVRDVARAVGDRWGSLAGVGLAAQGGSGCLFGRSDGRARTPMQLWNDVRPFALLSEIAAQRPQAYWRELAFLDGPGAGLGRLVWLRERFPDAWDGDVLYGGAGEYLFFQFTGQWRQDAGNALQVGCYDARSEAIAVEPLSLVGAGPGHVAGMRRGHETHPLRPAAAKLLGCRPGVPVAGPYMDHEAGFLAAAASAGPDVLQCSLGTAWVGNSLQAALPPPPGGMNLVLPAPIDRGRASGASDGERLLLRVLPAGNATLDWAFATFAGGRGAASRRRAEEILARRLLPPAGLVALPWLTRPNPLAEAGGCGGVLGADTHTGRDDLLRASVAGLCFAFRHVLEPVLAAGGVDPILLTGGASQSSAVRSLLAALLHPRAVRYSADADQIGTGGSVWAFNPLAARRETRPVAPPQRGVLADVTAAYARFTSACAALAAGPAGARGSPLGPYRRSPNE